jgi:hypothetical protein
MGKVIIGTYDDIEVGERYGTKPYEYLTDKDRVMHHQQPFVVLRESSLEEYLKQQEVQQSSLDGYPPDWTDGAKFYEVSID